MENILYFVVKRQNRGHDIDTYKRESKWSQIFICKIQYRIVIDHQIPSLRYRPIENNRIFWWGGDNILPDSCSKLVFPVIKLIAHVHLWKLLLAHRLYENRWEAKFILWAIVCWSPALDHKLPLFSYFWAWTKNPFVWFLWTFKGKLISFKALGIVFAEVLSLSW